jgi:hypothetical protein
MPIAGLLVTVESGNGGYRTAGLFALSSCQWLPMPSPPLPRVLHAAPDNAGLEPGQQPCNRVRRRHPQLLPVVDVPGHHKALLAQPFTLRRARRSISAMIIGAMALALPGFMVNPVVKVGQSAQVGALQAVQELGQAQVSRVGLGIIAGTVSFLVS